MYLRLWLFLICLLVFAEKSPAQFVRRGPWYSHQSPAYAPQWWQKRLELRGKVPRKILSKEQQQALAEVHNTRYLFGASAFIPPRNSKHVHSVWGSLTRYQYGLRPYASISAGTDLISGIALLTTGSLPVLFVEPKVGFSINDHHHVALNGIAGFAVEEPFSIVQSLYTLGDQRRHLTLGVSMATFKGADRITWIYSLAYLKQLGPRTFVMTENYLLGPNGGLSVMSLAIRRLQPKGVWDFGIIHGPALSQALSVPLPFLSYLRRL